MNRNLDYPILEVIQSHSWTHYFRAGDTPTLLYLLENFEHNDPSQSTRAGKFTKLFPESRPHYKIDDVGTEDWNYEDPCESWDLAQEVYRYRIKSLTDNWEEMYAAFRKKMETLYGIHYLTPS